MNEHEKENEGGDEYIERVRRRAHAIWMDQGQVHGRDREHWHEAEREIVAETVAHGAPGAAEAEPVAPKVAEVAEPKATAEPEKKAASGSGSASPLAAPRAAISR